MINLKVLKKGMVMKLDGAITYFSIFMRWIFISVIIGLITGIIGIIFQRSVAWANEFRIAHSFLIYCLPIGGLFIILFYRLCKIDPKTGTNLIINSIRSDCKIPSLLAPLIFFGTVVTHLLGGSAGREGAALQLGGTIGSQISRFLHLDAKVGNIVVMCGMSGVFSALFGTPVTAVFFAMEVISVGVIYYAAFVPSILSALTAYKISLLLGGKSEQFHLLTVPNITASTVCKVILFASLCGGISIVFCTAMHKTDHLFQQVLHNDYLRILTGGLLITLLTVVLNTEDYNGAGVSVIERAIGGIAKPDAFFWKILFTAVTIGAGFKGGEIVPAFFIGATFGCSVGKILGIDPGFAAALGLIAVFCGSVNCLFTSIVLSVEMFGSEGLILFAIASGVSYMLSGNYGLYSSQKILYSKLKAEFVNLNAK